MSGKPLHARQIQQLKNITAGILAEFGKKHVRWRWILGCETCEIARHEVRWGRVAIAFFGTHVGHTTWIEKHIDDGDGARSKDQSPKPPTVNRTEFWNRLSRRLGDSTLTREQIATDLKVDLVTVNGFVAYFIRDRLLIETPEGIARR